MFSEKSRTTDVEVAYRTSGFKWKADYSVILNEKENKADMGGWVTIDNRSGKKYDNARLKLIAGDVNTVKKVQAPQPVYKTVMARSGAVPSAPPSFSEKSFSDFHLYTLSEPVTLNDNSQKQVEFLSKVYEISVRKYHLISISSGGYSQTNLKAQNKIDITNS